MSGNGGETSAMASDRCSFQITSLHIEPDGNTTSASLIEKPSRRGSPFPTLPHPEGLGGTNSGDPGRAFWRPKGTGSKRPCRTLGGNRGPKAHAEHGLGSFKQFQISQVARCWTRAVFTDVKKNPLSIKKTYFHAVRARITIFATLGITVTLPQAPPGLRGPPA